MIFAPTHIDLRGPLFVTRVQDVSLWTLDHVMNQRRVTGHTRSPGANFDIIDLKAARWLHSFTLAGRAESTQASSRQFLSKLTLLTGTNAVT